MGLLCSKDQKQTANVVPVADPPQKINNDVGKKTDLGAEEENRSPISPPSTNAEEPQPKSVPQSPRPADSPQIPHSEMEDEEIGYGSSSPDVRTPVAGYEETVNGTRIAVVGSCESGKSTVCQQIKILCKESPHTMELQHRPAYINDYLFSTMRQLVAHMRKLGMSLHDPSRQRLLEMVENSEGRRGRPLLPDEISGLVDLWNDESIREAYNHRGEINLNDSVKYFYNEIHRITEPTYVPTVEDLVMLYVPTIGVSQHIFEISGNNYLVYDVSGRLMERKKWLSLYDSFDAVVFTLAISEFDQFFEDSRGRHCRLSHALDLLEETASDPKLRSIPIFLFLNETDIFKEKLTRFSLKDFLPTYSGSSEKEALAFVKQLAMDRCSQHPERLHVFFTTAVNTRKMSKVLNEFFKKVGRN